jgi:hypothetical protein
MERKCYKCEKIKPIEVFCKNRQKKSGYEHLCKECKNARVRETRWYCYAPITREEYNKQAELQDYKCAICNRPANMTRLRRTLFADHDHSTNKFRELICPRCNNALGIIDDDPVVAKSIVDYLTKHGSISKSPMVKQKDAGATWKFVAPASEEEETD